MNHFTQSEKTPGAVLRPLRCLPVALLLFAAALSSGCDRAGADHSTAASQNIPWIESFDAALAKAKSENKPVLLDFWATWCGPCKMMERQTYPDGTVAAELTNWISAKLDVDKNPDVAKRFSIDAIPTIVLLRPDGNEITRNSGFMEPREFVAFARNGRQTSPK
jgi:thioredoxin-like negative regulator of GroEL